LDAILAAFVDVDLDIVLRAKQGDEDALAIVWQAAIPVAKNRARLTVARYFWIDADDFENELLLSVPRFLKGFDPNNASGTSWGKYQYFRMVFEAKDILRCEDPLGIKWPQKGKGHYPEWFRLGDESFSSFDAPSHREFEPIENLICDETQQRLEKVDLEDDGPRWTVGKKRPRKIKASSIKSFLKSAKRKRRMEELQTQAENPTENPSDENFSLTPGPKPKKKPGPPKGSPGRGGIKKGTKKKAAAKSAKVEKAPSASDSLLLAMRFVDSVGGIRKGIELLELLSVIRK
jgi:hypothetical protein